MKHRLTAKLKSQRGASLPLALFLFMICAILASVVLAASTAASGRQSQLIQNDQRYYSVVSAADTIKKIFGENVTFRIVTEKTSVHSAGGNSTSSKLESIKLVGKDAAGEETTTNVMPTVRLEIPQKTALCMLIGDDYTALADNVFEEKVTNIPSNNVATGGIVVGNNYELVHIGSIPNGASRDALKVSVEDTINEDRDLQLTLTSSESSGNAFSLSMTLEPVISERIIKDESRQEIQQNQDGSISETMIDTTTRELIVSWDVVYMST